MEYFLHDVSKGIQKNSIVILQSIINRLMNCLYEEPLVIFVICICLPMQQHPWQWYLLLYFVVAIFGIRQQAFVLKFFYCFVDDVFVWTRQIFIWHFEKMIIIDIHHDDCGVPPGVPKSVLT